MRAFSGLPTVSLALLVLAPASPAQQKKKPPAPASKAPAAVDWQPGPFEKVLEEAQVRSVPVLLAFFTDEWENLRRVLDGLYKNEKFLAAASRCLCVVAVDPNPEHEPPKDGADKTRCSVFPTIACADHVRAAHELFERYAKDVKLFPVHIFFGPDGKERTRIETTPVTDGGAERDRQIVKTAEETIAAAGPALDRGLYVKFSEELPKAERALERDDLGPARAVFQEVAQAAKAGPFLRRAKAGLEEFERRAANLLAATAEREASGDVTGAYEAYLDLERALAGSPQEKQARGARQRLEQAPKTREAIAAHRRAKEAAALLAEARGLLAKGEGAKAAKILARIVQEFRETSSAEIAEKELRGLKGKDSSVR